MSIGNLKDCLNIQDLYDFTLELKPQRARWGGWTFHLKNSDDYLTSREIIQHLEVVFRRSIQNKQTAKTTLDLIGRIKELNQQGRNLIKPWYQVLITFIRHWIENLKYHTTTVLDKIENRSRLLYQQNFEQKMDRDNRILDDKDTEETSMDNEVFNKDLKVKEHKNILLPAINWFRIKIEDNKIDPSKLASTPVYVKIPPASYITFNLSHNDSNTVETLAFLVATTISEPITSIKLFFAGQQITSPHQLDKPLANFNFRQEGCCYLMLRSPETSKDLQDFISQLNVKDNFKYSSLDFLETSIFSLIDHIQKGIVNQYHAELEDLKKFLNLLEKEIQNNPIYLGQVRDREKNLDYVLKLMAVVNKAEELYQGGLAAISNNRKANFLQFLESYLKMYPAISCREKNSKLVFCLNVNHRRYIFDKETLQSQLGNGEMEIFFTAPTTKEINLEIPETLFFNLHDYLMEGNLHPTPHQMDEELLVDLYALASQLVIPRLEIQCSLEIASRLIHYTWQHMDLLDPYRNLEEVLLGKTLKECG